MRINCFGLHAIFLFYSFIHPKNLTNYRCSCKVQEQIFFNVILHVTILNPEIRSANTANLIPMSCPSVISSTLSACGQIRFRRHGQFLYANLLITQRKHIGRVQCSLCRVYSRVSLAVLLFSAFPVLLFALRRFEMLTDERLSGDGNRRKFHTLDKITTGCVLRKKQLLSNFYSPYFHVDGT